MEIQIGRLHEMHPRLPLSLILTLVERAALALQRNEHEPGVSVAWDCGGTTYEGAFSWPAADMSTIDQHDENQITEYGAEAVVLALAHRHFEWRVVRRLQREEHADWLLEYDGEGRRELVAMEVSGVASGSIRGRIAEKLVQVAMTTDVDHRWAGVVGFEEPTAALRSTKGRNE